MWPIFFCLTPIFAFERASIGENIPFILSMLAVLFFFLCIGPVLWIFLILRKCYTGTNPQLCEEKDVVLKAGIVGKKIAQVFSYKTTKWIAYAYIVMLILLNFFFVWVFPLVMAVNGTLFVPSTFMLILLSFPILSCIVSGLATLLAIYVWVRRLWFASERVFFCMTVFTSWFFIPWYSNLNLFGFQT